MLTQRRYPNRLELEFVPGVTTWILVSTDGVGYASLAALRAAGKQPWPNSFTLTGTLTPGIDPGGNTGLGPLLITSDAGAGVGGSYMYATYNQATQPATDNPGSLIDANTVLTFDDVGSLWTVWVRMSSASDKVRLELRY